MAKKHQGKSFQGSIVLGKGFVLTPEEANALITKDAKNKDVIFPYLNGDDLNSNPNQQASRFVINFFDWPIEKAMEYPDCFKIIEEKVKPERELLDEIQSTTNRNRKSNWWLYGSDSKNLYTRILNCDKILCHTRVTKTHSFSFPKY